MKANDGIVTQSTVCVEAGFVRTPEELRLAVIALLAVGELTVSFLRYVRDGKATIP
ncbi:MAG: hypothetical protein OXN97_24190 [Bryobacterales bacterium]|nr:hypothetical protein [Bryobacterales bacterium]